MKRAMVRLSLLMMSIVVLSVIAAGCSKEKSFEKGDGPTLRSTTYDLNEVNGSGVDGNIVISENGDSTFNVLVNLNSSVKDSVYVFHLHNGSTESPGPVALELTTVQGSGNGIQSLTANIRELTLSDSSVATMTYEDMLGFQGFVDVHIGSAIDSTLAEGTIGN